jgi:hypothetical protein
LERVDRHLPRMHRWRRTCVALASSTLLLAAADVSAQTSEAEERWKVVSPPAFIPGVAEFRWMLVHDVNRLLRELDRAAIVRPGPEPGCRQYFKDNLELGSLVLTTCVSARAGDAVVVLNGRHATVELDIKADRELDPRALARLDLETAEAIRQLNVIVTRPTRRVVLTYDNADETTVQVPLQLRLARKVSVQPELRVWQFFNSPASGSGTVVQWAAIKSGESFSEQLTLHANGQRAELGKIPFFGAINRWVIEPLCTMGEQVRAAVADAIRWPEVLDTFKRTCSDEGIRVGGKRASFPEKPK